MIPYTYTNENIKYNNYSSEKKLHYSTCPKGQNWNAGKFIVKHDDGTSKYAGAPFKFVNFDKKIIERLINVVQ